MGLRGSERRRSLPAPGPRKAQTLVAENECGHSTEDRRERLQPIPAVNPAGGSHTRRKVDLTQAAAKVQSGPVRKSA